ncbi:hypothetical protein ACK8OR_05505 [Jannaschia sp. KMU-145]|uniref:hypothetical protein n=1 Tax=Jannaschia halovivens TaxID=3388667 RepID=UPI00396B2418
MFARVTPFKMKAGSRDAAIRDMQAMKEDIMALPGMQRFVNVMAEDGSGYVISLVESEEVSNANADKVAALWSRMRDHLESPPESAGFNVEADWAM